MQVPLPVPSPPCSQTRLPAYSLLQIGQLTRSLVYLLCCLGILCLPLTSAWGYYLDNIEETPLLIRDDAPVSRRQQGFTIQDNLHLFVEQQHPGPILLPPSDCFVAADHIDANIPIFSLFRNPSPPGQDPLANLLYANLRLRKLLDDYVHMQKQAIALINNSYRSGRMDVTARLSTMPRDTMSPQDDNAKTSQLAREVTRLQQHLATIDGAATTMVYGPGNSQSSEAPPKGTFASLHDLQLAISRKEGQLQSSPYHPDGNGSAADSPMYQPGNTTPQLNNPGDRPTEKAVQATYSGSESIRLPWILDLPFRLIDFALNHKILSASMGIFCLLLLNIIFGARS